MLLLNNRFVWQCILMCWRRWWWWRWRQYLLICIRKIIWQSSFRCGICCGFTFEVIMNGTVVSFWTAHRICWIQTIFTFLKIRNDTDRLLLVILFSLLLFFITDYCWMNKVREKKIALQTNWCSSKLISRKLLRDSKFCLLMFPYNKYQSFSPFNFAIIPIQSWWFNC